MVIIHAHARTRMLERGATEAEIIQTIETGVSIAALHERSGFRQDFLYRSEWNGRYYYLKQIDVYAVSQNNDWIVVTVLVKYI